jgi:hypothetical protein
VNPGQQGNRLGGSHPLLGVDEDPAASMLDTRTHPAASRADDLLHREVERVAQPQLRDEPGLPDREAGRLAGGEVGGADAVSLDEENAALTPTGRVHRHSCRAQRLDVAQHRPDRDLESPGEHRGREATVRLEQEHQRQQTVGAHEPRLGEET